MYAYQPLQNHLQASAADQICMTFAEIESLLGRKLPPTARGDHSRQWWANSDSHTQAKAWLRNNRKAKIEIGKDRVIFIRNDQHASELQNGDAGPLDTSSTPDILISRRSLNYTAARLIENFSKERGVDAGQAVAELLNQMALRQRRETLEWFAQNTTLSSENTADLIRADRDAR
jgi:hypothetical protein